LTFICSETKEIQNQTGGKKFKIKYFFHGWFLPKITPAGIYNLNR
jgi:hypothetical protein